MTVRESVGHLYHVLAGTGVGRIPGVQWSYMRLTGGRTSVNGYDISVQRTDDGLLTYGDGYEPGVGTVFDRVVSSGDTVVDVGASLGYYTMRAADRVGPHGTVIAIEPDPERYRGLLQTISYNDCINIRPMCEVVGDGRRIPADYIEGWAGDIQTTRLDDLVSVVDPPDVIKIDVEGAEYHVLEGMTDILAAPDPPDIICEVHPDLLATFDTHQSHIVGLLDAYGYKIDRIHLNGTRQRLDRLSEVREHYIFHRGGG